MTDDTKTITAEQARAWLEAALGACDAMADAGCRLSAPMVAGTLERFAHSLEAERQRADELEAALKASKARVGVLEDALWGLSFDAGACWCDDWPDRKDGDLHQDVCDNARAALKAQTLAVEWGAEEIERLRSRADELEAALKASKARVGDARIMAGLILSAYDPATPADRAAPTAAAAIERAHRFLLDTKPTALSSEEGV